jgi:hypothetical protein
VDRYSILLFKPQGERQEIRQIWRHFRGVVHKPRQRLI